MNYQKIYNDLVESAKFRPDIPFLNGYTETHHILPKSMGGTDNIENLVKLTAREHFVAHHLLWRIYRTKEMAYAFWEMCNHKTSSKNKRNYNVTSKQYEIARKSFIIFRKSNPTLPNLNGKADKEYYKKVGMKISQAKKGKKFSEAHKQSMRNIVRQFPVTDLLENNLEIIKEQYSKGVSARKISKIFNCHHKTMNNFLKSKNITKK